VRVLVTGGHGFVGSHLVSALLSRGDRVRCLVRRDGVPEALRGLDVEVVRGDLSDAARLRAALEGIEEVHHLAALTRSRTRREMLETNAQGTARILAAAADARLPGRFLLCSSLAATAPSPDGAPITEEHPPAPLTWYGESKAAAEALARRYADRLAVTVVRPPAVYGPRDRDFLALFRTASRGFVPILQGSPQTLSLVYAEDLAEGILAVARASATVGRTYFLAHPEVLPAGRLLEEVHRVVGGAGRRIVVPRGALRLLAAAGELLSQLTGAPPLLNRQRLREMGGAHWVCSPAAAERDAGWRARVGIAEGFERTHAWYRSRGWL
jgi:nucleoside-diphosphate-sugar epimerase